MDATTAKKGCSSPSGIHENRKNLMGILRVNRG
jgi:hypothetical protein